SAPTATAVAAAASTSSVSGQRSKASACGLPPRSRSGRGAPGWSRTPAGSAGAGSGSSTTATGGKEAPPMPAPNPSAQVWKYVRGLAPPVIVLAVLVGWLAYALYARVHFWQEADEYNLREWVNEARNFRKTLPELVREYLDRPDDLKAQEIEEHLRGLGDPTKRHQGQLPLFPLIYRLEVKF